ncbi:MAG: tRNA uridine-5-carboxymethylaminomethyl(34) synthesis GTPase MnmE [Oscillospiraceae bacterium]|nr:tRNA uridine-5-carboxymethylaminomethyl(34) synthesis GTPase MnmE [Oscillospiraceae bacterium]
MDTIAAIATPPIKGGLGVIRISGSASREVAARLFVSETGKNMAAMPGYTAAFGHVYDGGERLDEAVALVFAAPKSYTGEDVVELSCHGGVYILRRVLETCLKNGARLAEPGEFTKRAFLNGKIDLTGAEAVMDMIGAENQMALKAALTVHSGALFEKISSVKDELLSAQAAFSAWVDFPDDEIPELLPERLTALLRASIAELEALLAGYDGGRILREGVNTAIAGSPNTGKSTLMNRLAGIARSIVSPVAGTTRDVVTQAVNIGGIPFNLADTAGIRQSADEVEKIGVELARRELEKADLLLAVFDGSRELEPEDSALLDSLPEANVMALLNKSDLPQKLLPGNFKGRFAAVLCVSAATGDGINLLLAEMERFARQWLSSPAAITVANERQRAATRLAVDSLVEAIAALEQGLAPDAVSVCVDSALSPLLELTGERVTDAVTRQIFSRFCVGK